mgnify:CR=1 FL=1
MECQVLEAEAFGIHYMELKDPTKKCRKECLEESITWS